MPSIRKLLYTTSRDSAPPSRHQSSLTPTGLRLSCSLMGTLSSVRKEPLRETHWRCTLATVPLIKKLKENVNDINQVGQSSVYVNGGIKSISWAPNSAQPEQNLASREGELCFRMHYSERHLRRHTLPWSSPGY